MLVMKRIALVAVVAVGFAAAACKNQTETASSQPAAPATAATETVAAPPQTPPASNTPGGGAEALVPRVSVAELNTMVKSGAVTVIDVRAADNYIAAHVPGSLHIPLSFIEQEAPYLPRGKKIVTYCT